MPLVKKPLPVLVIPPKIEPKTQIIQAEKIGDPYSLYNLAEQSLALPNATGESGSKKIEVTMDLVEHPNKRFMAKYHRYEPKVKDSTAIKALKKCSRFFFYTIVLGRTSKEDNVIFAWGSAYHVFREVLEVQYGIGVNAPRIYDERKGAEAFAKAYSAGMEYWKKHGREQEEGTKYGFMTKGRLHESFIKAYKHWEAEKKIGRIKVISVEQPLIVQLEDGSYTGGKCDQLIRVNGLLWGRDWKTTTQDLKFYPRSLEPNDQFTRYTVMESYVAGEQVQGQYVEVLYNNNNTKKEKKGPEVQTFVTERTKQQLQEFEKEQAHWNRVLELHREHDVWPMEEHACWNCAFHSVCKKPTESGMMAQLEMFFTVRPWDFTRIGEE